MKEIWKDAIGYENKWQVSNLGRLKRKANGRLSEAIRSPKRPASNGYIIISNRKDGKKEGVYLHRLVAKTFIPNPENKPMINHIDGNRVNNRVDNLEWVTNGENMKHSFRSLQHNSNPVKCVETGDVFINCPSAAEWLLRVTGSNSKLKTTTSHIWESSIGKRKYVYGYRWEKVKEMA